MNRVRKFLLAIGVLGLVMSAAATVKKPSIEPRWFGANQAEWTMDRAAALANAKADGRWTLVLLTGAWWNPWCQSVEEKVFNTEAWNDYAVANGYYEVQTDYPARDGRSYPCWLWDKGFQEKNGLTPEEAASNIVENLKYQADVAQKLPGTYGEKEETYLASNMVAQIDWEKGETNRWETYAQVPASDYKSDVEYGTIFVYAPTGELVGRFPSAVRDGYDENKNVQTGKVWTAEEAFAQITNRIEKAKGGKSYVRVSVDSECEEMGSVTKVDKLFAKGETVTLKATAKSGYVFAGWYAYGIPLTDFSFDYRTASASFKADGKDRIITALFAAKSDDKYISISCEPEDGYSVANAMSLPVRVSSRSLPTVTAKPLPDGLKLVAPSAANGWCATITGTPTKPSQEVTTTITVKNASATSSKDIVLRIRDKQSILLPELKYDTGYTFAPGDKPNMADVLGEATMEEITTNTNWSVSGLPDGMKFDANKRIFTGAPTQASKSYVVTFTLKSGNTTVDYATVVFRTTAFPETKLEPWFDYVMEMEPISTNGVKLTGGKACAAGTVLSLSAKAPTAEKNKDSWVFAGWYSEKDSECALNNGTQDWRLASGYKFTSLTNDVTIYARFVPKSLDVVGEITCQPTNQYEKGEQMAPLAVTVVSYSKPTVTMKPLPAGMKFDANALVVTGTPTKDGEEQTAIIMVKNVSGAKATKSVVLKVKDLEAKGGLSGLKYDTGYTFIPGDTDLVSVLGSQLLNELGLGGWTVSGLPAGMKWDSKKNTITGAATKELTSYTVKFTSKTDKNDIATVSFRTSAFPVTTLEPWFDDFETGADIWTYGVKLTGGKACAAGTVLSLSATAPKAVKERGDEWVFAGWYSEKAYDSALNNGTQDWRLASGYKFTSLTNDVTIFARFVPKSEEAKYAKVECSTSTSEYETGKEISPILVVTTAYTLPTVKVTGLPAGLKFTDKDVFNKTNKIASANTIYGTPTKSGVYVATVTMTTAGKATAATTVKFIVRKDGELKLDVDYDALLGKVTGAGIYQTGKKVTLKATANKGYVFNGWYESKEAKEPLRQATSLSWPVDTNDVTLVAKFISTADDWAKVSCTTTTVEYAAGVDIEPIVVTAEGGSLPTVKVVGLPAGLKFDARLSVISGKPTKSGVYAATVTATTAGKATKTATLKFIVRKEGEHVVDVDYDAEMGKVTGMGVYAAGKKVTLKATANKGYVFTGWWEGDDPKPQAASYVIDEMPTNDVMMAASFITDKEDEASIVANVNGLDFSSEVLTQGTNVSCGVHLVWPVLSSALTMPTTVKVSGLPSGLTFKDGVIYGTPTKSGLYRVKVTVTSAGKTKQEFLLLLDVDPLPAWAVGNFDGSLIDMDVEVAEGVTNRYTGTTTFTVGSNGKISGSANTALGKITFSAASFDRVDENGRYWVDPLPGSLTYNGKTVKMMFVAGLQPLPTGLGTFACMSATEIWAGKSFDTESHIAFQNPWKSRKDLNYYPSFPTGSKALTLTDGELMLTFDKDGAVKVSGKVPGDNETSVSVSGSAQVLPVIWDGNVMYACVEVFVAPKTNLADGFFKEYKILLTSDGTKFVDVRDSAK